jgi:O-antigen ligase
MCILTLSAIGGFLLGGTANGYLFDKQNRVYVYWFISFFVFFELHYSYVHWDDFSLMRALRIWLPPLIAFVWLSKVKSNDLFNFFGKCCVIASVPIIVMIVLSTGLSMVSDGERYSGEDFNLDGNTIAVHMLFLIFFSLILYKIDKKWRPFILVMMIIMTLLIIISGCRRAIIGVVLVFISYFLSFGREKQLKSVVQVAIVLIIISYLLINVEIFYDVAGYRMEKIFINLGLMSDSKNFDSYDYSAEIRGEMIPIALLMFYSSPLVGNGYAFFITHSGLNISTQNYSTHNNYLEILVNYGISGFIFYYIVIFYILYYLIKYRKRSWLNGFILSFFLVHLLVIEPTTVNFCNYSVFYILYYILFRVVKASKNNLLIV